MPDDALTLAERVLTRDMPSEVELDFLAGGDDEDRGIVVLVLEGQRLAREVQRLTAENARLRAALERCAGTLEMFAASCRGQSDVSDAQLANAMNESMDTAARALGKEEG